MIVLIMCFPCFSMCSRRPQPPIVPEPQRQGKGKHSGIQHCIGSRSLIEVYQQQLATGL